MQYTENIPTQPAALFPQRRVIFTPDDYTVHFEEPLYNKGTSLQQRLYFYCHWWGHYCRYSVQ